jgi:hypothetical protein
MTEARRGGILLRKNKARTTTTTIMIIASTLIMASALITLLVLSLPGAHLGRYHEAMAQTSNTTNSTTLTYQNPDIGLTMQYPSNWVKQEGNLVRNTIAAFVLKQNQFHNSLNFANTTLAEVDLRVYPAPPNETLAKFNLSDINLPSQAIINHYKNSTTTLGGLPAIKLVSYLFGAFTDKTMQVWTYVPSKHIFVGLIYIVQPPQYSLYLPAVQSMINSVKIAR